MRIENFTKFINYYGKDYKFKLFVFFIISLVVGALEFTGIALIYPFILLIINPESIIYTKYYALLEQFTHSEEVIFNAFVIGVIVIAFFIAKNLCMVVNLYLQNKFLNNWKYAISKKIMHYYLFCPYKNSLETPPSEKLYNLTFLIANALDNFIFRVISMVTNAVIVSMILLLLFIKFPFAAFVTSLFVAFSLFIQNKLLKAKMQQISQKLIKVVPIYNEKIMENIVNIKEIKILSAENIFFDNFLHSQKDYNEIVFKNNFYNGISPYIIETLIVLSLFILAGIISVQAVENTSWMIASYAIVAAAIFRITPALNRIQSSLNAINAYRDVVKRMIEEYEKNNFDVVEEKSDAKVEFHDNIRLENISFAYKKEPVIKDLSITIKKGEFIGIIGASGAGKSTLADIIMGLLPVDEGKIFVDEISFTQQNFSALRKLIGYVPQQINILDGSFKRNVAWGSKDGEDERVIEVLKKAQLWEFVEKFDEGVNAKVIVGSAGLSQGQKQRLAIARALYRDADILILDEATSSLDVETEHAITQMLKSVKGEKTVIAIAHRLSTLKSCDRLVYLKNGQLVDTGTFDDLSKKHPDFDKLIKLSNLTDN